MRWVLLLTIASGLRLAAQPHVSAWELLQRELADDNPDRRKQAVLAVGTIGPAPEVIEILNRFLRDPDVAVRQSTAALMGEFRYEACIPNLRAALDDEAEVAVQAAKSLWAMGDRSGKRVLEGLYTGEQKSGPGFFESAVRDARQKLRNPSKLITLGVHEASGALLGPFSLGILAAQDMLKDGGAPGRALAADLLSRECDARAVQLMEWSLENDRNDLVRAATAKALGRCGNATTTNRLMVLLADNNAAVRDMAAAAIVRLNIQQRHSEGVDRTGRPERQRSVVHGQ